MAFVPTNYFCLCLQQSTHDPSTYSYCLKSGTMELLTAACDWYERRYGVKLDPKTEALSLIGEEVHVHALLLFVLLSPSL